MHTVWLSRMGPVPSLWRGSNRWSATVAWAKARLSRALAQLLEAPPHLAARTPLQPPDPLESGVEERRRGDLFTAMVTARDARPRSTPTALPLGGNGSRSPPPRSWRRTGQPSP